MRALEARSGTRRMLSDEVTSRKWQNRNDLRGTHDAENLVGEWNVVECRCETNRIQIRFNGVLVNMAFDVWPTNGPILFQCEGSEAFFRKFELQRLK
jgi:hypothetical protein